MVDDYLNLKPRHPALQITYTMRILAIAASFVASAYAFADTAPLFAVPALPSGDFKYITDSHKVSRVIKEYTEQLCMENAEKLFIYRVSQWSSASEDAFAGLPEDSTHISHVHYKSSSDLDLDLHSSCSVEYKDGGSEVSGSDANVVVVDWDEGSVIELEELLKHSNVIVQVKPKFATALTYDNYIKEFLDSKLHLNLDKRTYVSDDEDVMTEESFDDLEDDFMAAEALLLATEDDIEVTAEKKNKPNDSNDKKKKSSSNLFTEYQFFTPGVWLSIIVSLFLVFVATTAIGWITSIELSYKSFEKQVDYEKKNE